MGNDVIFNEPQNGLILADTVLKTTSLLYFKEALVNQRYEDCAELVLAAKSFGAQPDEISQIINEVILPRRAEPDIIRA